ncbi:MAG: baseplate J/gp47 family protein [Candidatus Pacearchaeota archaeon]|jgi:uncharacterized phage protein gp47/JayE
MSIIFPENRQSVTDRLLSDVQNELPVLNPFLRTSYIRALCVGISGRIFDLYKQESQIKNEMFSQTAKDITFLRQIGLLKGIDVNPASTALGFITATGSIGSTITLGTIYQNESDIQYEVINGNYNITQHIYNVGITRSGIIATVTTSINHKLAPNISVTIAGANESEYNGTFTILETTENTFTYTVSGSPATPATGTITATSNVASVEIQSVETGQDKNLDSGAKLTLLSPIVGVDDDAYVQAGKIAGGEDEEEIESYRARVLDAYANPISNFNDADITKTLKEIPWITKVWTFDAYPVAGEIEVYFIRANDDDIIPTPAELLEAKTELLKIKTAPMLDDDVNVIAPTKVPVDFVFTDLVPNSQSMQNTIKENLIQFFKEIPDVSIDLIEDAYRSIIYQTINPETGEHVESFTLSSPVGDITISHGQLAVYNSCTFLT